MTDIERIKEGWLKSRRTRNTRETYALAVKNFEGCADLATADQWDMAEFKERLVASGCSAATVNLQLAALSSFYQYAMRQGALEKNPATLVERMQVTPYGKSSYLAKDDCRRLLAAIDRRTYKGMRDYALIFGYLMTGLRNSAWRVAKWEDFSMHQGKVYFSWALKGKSDRAFIAPPLWETLSVLRACSSGAFAHVFVGTAQRVVRGEMADEAIDRSTANKILKAYAAKVGLDESTVHIHMLRHSFAVLCDEAGDDLITISRKLGHSSFAVTQVYMDRVKRDTDATWQTVSEYLGVEQ